MYQIEIEKKNKYACENREIAGNNFGWYKNEINSLKTE